MKLRGLILLALAFCLCTATAQATKVDGEIRSIDGQLEVGWARFDISAIPDGDTVTSIDFHFYVNDDYYPYWSAQPLTNDPLTADGPTLWADITADMYPDPSHYFYRQEASLLAMGWYSEPLINGAAADLQAALPQDWFALGIADTDSYYTQDYYLVVDGHTGTNPPYLVVTHSSAIDPAYCYPTSGLYSTGTTDDAPIGACCYGDGSCADLTSGECLASYGDYLGDGTDCLSSDCSPYAIGACCFINGSCSNQNQYDCEVVFGGTFQGVGTQCATTNCGPPPALDCPLDTLFGQIPGRSDTGHTSNEYQQAADNFYGLSDPVCDIHFWMYFEHFFPCLPPMPMDFEIIFYNDDAGLPGTTACTYSVSLTGTDTGYTTDYGSPIYAFSTDLAPCCALTAGWVSISVAAADPNCTEYFLSSPLGDDTTAFGILGGWSLVTGYPDLAFCLTPGDMPACSDDLIDLGTLGCPDSLVHTGNTVGATDWCGDPSGDEHVSFTLLNAGTVTITTCSAGTDFDTVLHLYDDICCGNEIGYNDNDLACLFAPDQSTISENLAAGTYYVQVEGAAGAEGNFDLAIQCDVEDCNDDLVDLGILSCPGTTLLTGDTTGAPNACGNDAGDHHHKFEITQDWNFTFTTCMAATAFDTYLRLYDDACCGNQINFNDDDSGCGYSTLHSTMTELLTPGIYYLQVEGYAAQEGYYELEMSCSDPLDCTAGLVDLGTISCPDMLTVSGDTTLAPNVCGNLSGEIHYTFTVPNEELYTFTTCNAATGYDTYLRLYDDICCGNQIEYNDDDPGCAYQYRSTLADILLTPGQYYLAVEGYSALEGYFELEVSCTGTGMVDTVLLASDRDCYLPGETVTVDIDLVGPTTAIVGGQFFLEYDNLVLDFEGFGPGSDPFDDLIYTVADEGGGTLDVAVGVPASHPGATTDTTMVVLTFTALQQICAETGLVTFRPHTPPSRLSDYYGEPVDPALLDLDIADTTPPVITCPADVTAECSDSRDPVVNPAMGEATATDNCDAAPVVTFSDAENLSACGGYTGTVARTWTATDHCGNVGTCVQTITVVDTTPPTITCPAPVSVQCIGDVPAPDTGLVSATDNCDLAPVVTHMGDVSDGLNCPETITRTYRATDACGNFADCTQIITAHDTIPPSVACPADIVVNADAGDCSAIVNWTVPVVSDNCDPSPAVVCIPAPGTAFTGTTTVTCTATDACGNSNLCTFTVTVNPANDLLLDLSLSPTMDPAVTRCITLDLWNCTSMTSVTHEEVVSFSSGSASLIVEVPCGDYDCITVRDRLHTLSRTIPLATAGTQYAADFVSVAKPLINGNLNDDPWIDILDFGVFSWQFFTVVPGSTDCATAYPHVDINGDGVVDSLDFSFIQINFLAGSDAGCCGTPAPLAGPVTAISVKELFNRGMGELAVADLNGDGMLDTADVTAFMLGQRPQTKPTSHQGPKAGE